MNVCCRLIAIFSLAVSHLALASGVDGGDTNAFVNPYGPDNGMTNFARGNLGIPAGSYFRVYLLAAYHLLQDRKFTESEIAQLEEACCSLRESANRAALASGRDSQNQTAIHNWLQARSRYAKPALVKALYQHRLLHERETFQTFLNCPDGALRHATATLEERVTQFGKDNVHVQNWIEGQDATFQNCGTAPDRSNKWRATIPDQEIPGSALSGAPRVFVKDRDYQIAAAYFYSGVYGEAERRFNLISEDAGSPWADWAALASVRAKLREALLNEQWGEKYQDISAKQLRGEARRAALGALKTHKDQAFRRSLAKIEVGVRAILADPKKQRVHAAARGTLGYAQATLDSAARLAALGVKFSRTPLSTSNTQVFSQDLIDLLLLLDQVEFSDKPMPSQSTEDANDLIDWMFTIKRLGGGIQIPDSAEDRGFTSIETRNGVTAILAARKHADDKWRTTRNPVWAYALISTLDVQNALAPELLAFAKTIPSQHPGYIAFQFHIARLESEGADRLKARERLDALLSLIESPSATTRSTSTRNLILRERIKLAQNYDELVKYLPRMLFGQIDNDLKRTAAEKAEVVHFDSDGVAILNHALPLSVWLELAKDARLPVPIRADIAGVGWFRAALIGNRELSRKFAELANAGSTSAATVISRPSVASRPAFVQDTLNIAVAQPWRRPMIDGTTGSGISHRIATGAPSNDPDAQFGTASWWCSLAPNEDSRSIFQANDDKDRKSATGFLNEQMLSVLAAEQAALKSLPNATDYYVTHVLEWARLHPKDPEVPKMLHNAVRSTRGGCVSPNTGLLSNRAYRLLHTRYKDSEWTSKTPYWYGQRR